MKIRLIAILLPLLLAACAGQFGSIQNRVAECGYPSAAFTKFHECMKTKISVSTKVATNDAYNKSNAEFLEALDELQVKINKRKISNRKAYEILQEYLNRKIVIEQQQAQQAAAVFAVLAGAAAVGICSSHHNCGGGGGAGYGAASIPLMCSAAPSWYIHCGFGKACGNSCITVSDECHVGAGTACNTYPRSYP